MTTAFGDTTTNISNFSEIVPVITSVAEVLEMEYAVMGNLVVRHVIPRGKDRVRIMYQTNQFIAEDHTDGEEITTVQQMGIDTIDLTTNMLKILYRISGRALRFPSEDLAVLCGQEQAKAQAEALEVRLLALTDDSGSIDPGLSGATNLAHFAEVRRRLRGLARSDGGPAPTPIVGVIDVFQEEDLLNQLGAVAALSGSSNDQSRVIPHFLQDIIQVSPSLDDAFFGTILRIPLFVSGYIGQTVGSVTAPSIGAVFSTEALHLGVAQEWESQPYDEVEWDGLLIRSLTDYGARLGAFPKWCLQLDTTVGS